jgi:hypothetical protein
MANNPYIVILQTAETFANNHLEIKRFASDFLEQLGNWATQSEAYPILFAVPGPVTVNANEFSQLANYTITFYALDVIQKDRSNINVCLNSTSQILLDLHKYYHQTEILDIDIIQASSLTPVNNYILDYVTGWSMTITFEVDTHSVCNVPIIPALQP